MALRVLGWVLLYAGAGLLITLGRLWIIWVVLRKLTRSTWPLQVFPPLTMLSCMLLWPFDLVCSIWLLVTLARDWLRRDRSST
jgi:hypothetical protein